VTVEFGVFGGSFDPPHVGHTLLAHYVLSAFALERVLVVPTYVHAFGKVMAPFEDRLRMCELAFGQLPRVSICDIERELPPPNLTLNTLHALARRHPDIRLRLLIGSDIVTETHAWHDFASIEKLAPPLIVQRQGYAGLDRSQPALPEVSSTELRRRLAASESTQGLISPAVADYARAHRLYGS
jgi:nicotinate-nucleotide adenylyltransferase